MTTKYYNVLFLVLTYDNRKILNLIHNILTNSTTTKSIYLYKYIYILFKTILKKKKTTHTK